jgi:hypothetical protein
MLKDTRVGIHKMSPKILRPFLKLARGSKISNCSNQAVPTFLCAIPLPLPFQCSTLAQDIQSRGNLATGRLETK